MDGQTDRRVGGWVIRLSDEGITTRANAALVTVLERLWGDKNGPGQYIVSWHGHRKLSTSSKSGNAYFC